MRVQQDGGPRLGTDHYSYHIAGIIPKYLIVLQPFKKALHLIRYCGFAEAVTRNRNDLPREVYDLCPAMRRVISQILIHGSPPVINATRTKDLQSRGHNGARTHPSEIAAG